MGANIWNLSARRGESLSKADADRRNQLMLESPSRSDGDLLRLLSERRRKGISSSFTASIKAWCIDSRCR